MWTELPFQTPAFIPQESPRRGETLPLVSGKPPFSFVLVEAEPLLQGRARIRGLEVRDRIVARRLALGRSNWNPMPWSFRFCGWPVFSCRRFRSATKRRLGSASWKISEARCQDAPGSSESMRRRISSASASTAASSSAGPLIQVCSAVLAGWLLAQSLQKRRRAHLKERDPPGALFLDDGNSSLASPSRNFAMDVYCP